ncbi:MAG: S-layer homology domain-containing protein [Clostridiales Family XIII bacterium]|jgi:hypothetical protein|nr:S-layer homology domain-containing protein [Clostridiales Family XIII bacterium]
MKTKTLRRTCLLALTLAVLFTTLCAAMPPPTEYPDKTLTGTAASSLEVRIRYADKNEFEVLRDLDIGYFEDKGVTQYFTFVDLLPTVTFDEATGVYLTTVLRDVGLKENDIERFTFWASDGQKSFSREQLLGYDGYIFPAILDKALWEPAGMGINILNVAAASEGKRRVYPMLAYEDGWYRTGSEPEPLTGANRMRVVFGMEDFSDREDGTFVPANASNSFKWVYRMDVELSVNAPATSTGSGSSGSTSGTNDTDPVDTGSGQGSDVVTGGVAGGMTTDHALTDVKGHWAEPDIATLVALGAVNGNPDGSFAPNSQVTRTQFVSMLTKAMIVKRLCSLDGSVRISDAQSHWGQPYLSTAIRQGILVPGEKGEVNPDRLITRQEMTSMLARALELTGDGSQLSYTDRAEIASWARDAVAALTENGGVTGFPDGSFHPLDVATKAQAAVAILRTFRNAGVEI